MITNTFKSHYLNFIFNDVEKRLKQNKACLIQDPVYLNQDGEYRFMITCNSMNDYRNCYNIISEMIGDYVRSMNHTQKLNINSDRKRPPPLNIIL